MVGLGLLMLAIMGYALYHIMRNHTLPEVRWLSLFPVAIAFPYLANISGWILTEMGRQPWIVFGLMKTSDGVSPVISPGMVWTSLIGFGLMYSVLLGVDAFLLVRAARAGPENSQVVPASPISEEAYVE